MTTLGRKLRRASSRRLGRKWEGKPQPTRLHEDGSYDTLRPTKGWLYVSARRRRAQMRLIALHVSIGERQIAARAGD